MTVGQSKQSGASFTNNGGQTDTAQIANFIWGIADDVLRDVYVRGKYRDVILPMIVLRRLDIVLESTKAEVLKQKEWLDKEKIVDQEQPLRAAAKQPFYNTSSGRSLRALSVVILVRYPLLIGTSGKVRESSISAYEFSSLVTSGELPTFWRRMRDLNPR